MPEEAPVMRTTFPATLSDKKERRIDKKYLNRTYGGRNNKSVINVNGGATRFDKLFINSIVSPSFIFADLRFIYKCTDLRYVHMS